MSVKIMVQRLFHLRLLINPVVGVLMKHLLQCPQNHLFDITVLQGDTDVLHTLGSFTPCNRIVIEK